MIVSPKRGGRSDIYLFQHRVGKSFPCSISSQGNQKTITLYKTYGVNGWTTCWLSKFYLWIDIRVKRVYMRWIRLLIHLFHLYINNIFIHLN